MPALEAPPAPSAPAAPAAPPSGVPAPPTPAPPVTKTAVQPTKTPAKDKLFQDLRKKSGVPDVPDVPAKPAEPAGAPPAGDTPPAEPSGVAAPEGEKGKGKVNPWKLIEEYKTKSATLEQEIAKLKTTALPEADIKAIQEKAEAAQKRAAELEQELSYIDYSKSQEFQTKYQAPYEAAWKRAISELNEIKITTPEGESRAVTPSDLLRLVNMPLGEARELADQAFGSFADDVMGHRKEIKSLFDQQQSALEEAKTKGVERTKAQKEAQEKMMKSVVQSVKTTWDEVNKTILSDEKYGSYFKPIEGDADGNARLTKGYELADRAFSENPMQPGLSEEDRKSIVKRHAAIRNRAAAFGRLVAQNQAAKAKIDALTKELEQFKASEPGGGERKPDPAGGSPMSAMERMRIDLRRRAK